MSKTFKTKKDPSYKILNVRIEHCGDAIKVVYKDTGIRVEIYNPRSKSTNTIHSFKTIKGA